VEVGRAADMAMVCNVRRRRLLQKTTVAATRAMVLPMSRRPVRPAIVDDADAVAAVRRIPHLRGQRRPIWADSLVNAIPPLSHCRLYCWLL
jgi:hypothetical protein